MASPLALLQDFVTKLAKEWLKQQVEFYVYYESRVQKLEGDVQKLQEVRVRVQDKVNEEENRFGNVIDDGVQKWLADVYEIIVEYDKFNKDEDREYATCSNGFLPKWWIRRRLGISADDIAKKVAGLLQKEPNKFSHWHGSLSMDAVLLNIDYVSFESRKETMNDIRAALEDWSVRMIGVHGWSGVGKTTLVKEVAKKARDDKLFNVVIMANVTRNPDIIKIQGQIAEMLGMQLEEKSDIARAARIRQRLTNEKQNTLIILDNLWAKLDFNLLGIPFANDEDDGKSLEALSKKKAEKVPDASSEKNAQNLTRPDLKVKATKLVSTCNETKTKETLSSYKGCKVLLVSETIQVLMSQMDGKQKSIFSVEVLKDKESEMLFKTMAGIGDNNSEFQKIAAQIANKCEGLPMSIVTTARALKNQRRPVWEDVHRKFERQKLTGAPEFSTKLSYDLLENEELKFTFLLCASMGRDALIMDLVKYCIGLGILEGLYTVREARVRVLSLLAKLKESGLLSDSYSSDCFTMQDMVRRATLSISFVERHEFTTINGKIDEWPDEDKLERYTVISLQHCDIIEDFPESINCPRLRVFHVDSNNPHLKIPDNFFKAMKELRVLIFSGIHLSPLPLSIGCLTKLRLLCLERCILGEKLCLIGELKNLRILSFSGSEIIELPGELKQLTKLQIFDISNCYKLAKIPFGVISGLISLEELYMRNTFVQWKVDGQPNESENACLSELRHLNKLTIVDIKIPNVSCLPNNLFFDKLSSYKIVIGDLHAYLETDFKMPEKHEASRFLGLHLNDTCIHSQKGIKMLFERVENLLLEKLSVKDIFYELNLKGFPYLKHLSIICNSDIQSLIKPKERQHPEKAFPKLESLYLYNVKEMKEICSSGSTLSAPSFGNLKVIKIKLCGKLKNVFLISGVELFTVLETVEVSECNSLEGIVQSNTKCLEFPKLRSLTLQSLSKFNGFYPISSEGDTKELFNEKPKHKRKEVLKATRELFDEKVIVSNLERMELSSIQIKHIWSFKPSDRPKFQNLIHLDVNDCCNLEYLFSFSMAKHLVKLQSLFVSECENMKYICQRQEYETKTKQDKVFPNLKNIKLTSMKSLSQIWNSELPFDSFGKVDTLIIENCDILVNVFPCYMVGIFQSLSNLRVTNCKKLKAIFDRNDQKQVVGELTNLQDVYLEALPKLEHVWKWYIDQQGILNMRNLQKVWIGDCDSLKYIFPVFIDNCLKNLEYLGVWNCLGLEEIVAKGEHNNTNTSGPPLFEFAKLTTIKFSELPKLKSFYSGESGLSFPALNDLSLELCDKLKPFTKESANAEKRPLFPEEVVNKLKSMQIESWHAKSSSSYMGNYRRDNLEELQLSSLENTEILYSFLHSSPYLKSLSLNNCFFEELVSLERNHEIENLGVVPKLKSLKLIDLPYLEKIGFERDTVLQRIEIFILESCPCLVTIVPSSVSFSHLTNLEVVNCNGLINLMPPSTAKSLSQLSTMKVVNCESLKEIISEQGIEEKNSGQIVFSQLEALELMSLENLKSFCSSESCVFEFPLLEKLVVNACPKMENFSMIAPTMPILQKMYVVHEKEKRRWYWEGDVNATILKMHEKKNFFEGMGELSSSNYQVLLQQASHGEVGLQNNWFYSLETLKLDRCDIQPYAIPSNVLPYLKSLKKLEVRYCDKVKGIFDEHEETTFQLKKLILEGLSNMTNVWTENCQGILSFQNLQEVVVTYCEKLRMVFPAPIAKNLKKLEKLEIEECNELLEIVGKEEAVAAAEEESPNEVFVFPCLTSLVLNSLPQLTRFYPKRFTLECPELNYLDVLDCGNLVVFERPQEAPHQGSTSNSNNTQFLCSELKVISNLEVLSLDWKGISNLEVRIGQFRKEGQSKLLQHLNELSLYLKNNVNEKYTLPIKVLEQAPNLATLSISDCDSREIFSTLCEGGESMLGHLKTLFLQNLSELECIGSSEESSWLNTICDKLHLLWVNSCPCLTTLVNSAVSLKYLVIENCNGLEYLFTSSSARLFIQLEKIHVHDCESMKEIIKAEDETTLAEIKFERLEMISLASLPSLECYYSGSATLKLQSLIDVVILECPEIKTFSQGSIHAESFRGINAFPDIDAELVFHNDLNATVKWLFIHKENRVLADCDDELRDMWLGDVPVSERSLSNLESLVVEGCEFLTNAILPSHLLPFLKKLKELEVKNCNSVEAIFDVKDTPKKDTSMGPASPLHLPLKKLTLEKLPNLKHVWNEDPQGSITSLPFLEEVYVKECENLKFLFPASEAEPRCALKTLHVTKCEELEEIVAKDEGTTDELIIFYVLASMRLRGLTKLKCFYPGKHLRKWPFLEVLDSYDCPMLKLFVTEFQNSADTHPEHQDCLPTDQHARVSAQMYTPELEELSLNKEDVMTIEGGQFEVDLPKLKFLRLQCFHDESDVFPYVFFSKVPLPNVKKLELVDCNFNEIFPSQRSDIEDTKILAHLKGLVLDYLPTLKSIGLEHSWVAPFTQSLENLKVVRCECLRNLGASTMSFSLLTQLIVQECHGLEYLFTSSTAKSLCRLTNISVRDCKSLQEIVFEEAVESLSQDKGEIIFQQLNTLYLHSLPSLGRFYNGDCAFKLPSLEQLSIIKCSGMVTFNKSTVIASKLSEVKFEEDADAVPLKVDLNSTIWNAFEAPVSLPHIETLEAGDCTLKEIVPSERPDIDDTKILSQIKGLEVNYLPMLESIGLEHSWMAPLPQIVKTLNVRSCECLTNLVPSTVSFSHLTQLIVYNCDGLEYLLTSSTVKCLGVLEKMEIANCKSLKQIVAKEGNEADENEIIFEHLNTLSLRSLTGVGKFYDGSCALSFPSLLKLSVIGCRRMVTFSEGTIIANKLSKVKFEENADAVPLLEGGLNSTIRNAFEAMEHLVLGDYHELDDVWLGVVPVPDRSFSNLKSLVVERCDFLTKVILPSHLLPFLRKLEELKVQKCNSVEAIFDVKDTEMGPPSPLHLGLKKIILKDLPNLKHVWNEDPQLIISLPFLEAVSVVGCKSIKGLFPASVAKGILKTLDVRRCEGLVEIVAKDEGATEGTIEELTIFPSLSSLTLWNLPKLKCFYPGMHNQEWPMLTVLDFYKCPMLKVFVTEFQNSPDSHPEGEDCLPINQQALISADKVTPHLEELALNKEDVIMIEQGQVHVDLLKLEYLKLQLFNDELDVFPYVFLSKVPLPCIERLEVGDSTFKEIFPSERPDVDDTKILSQLKGLELNYLPMLKSIGLDHSWMGPFPQILKTLNVKSCKCLTNLVPSTVSFSHLTILIVDLCHGLEYLFTSSTAKSLGVLEKMEITNCKSLKQIVEEEPSLKNNVEDEQEKDEPDEDEAKDDEPDEDEMIFGKLEILSLRSLPRLESFYTGSSTLKFPSLVEVSFTECDNMKMFCHGDVAVPKNLEGEIDGVHWSGVINTATNLS